MGKILTVDFKKKSLIHSWEDNYQENVKKVNNIETALKDIIQDMADICHDDKVYQRYIGRTLGEICLNLRERIKEESDKNTP